MANSISTQAQEKIDLVERSAIALNSLSKLCMDTNHGKLDDFRYLLDYLSDDMVCHIQDLSEFSKRVVLPLVADIKTFRVA